MKQLKKLLTVCILILTAILLVRYIGKHPEISQSLTQIPPLLVVILLLLYLISLGALLLILKASLQLAGGTIDSFHGILLTIYSAVINFFGPLQSGPGFRAVYLKKYHNISLKRYGLASLIYYVFFAIVSGIFFLAGTNFWWLAVPAVIFVGGLLGLSLKLELRQRIKLPLTIKALTSLLIGVILHLSIIFIIYWTELRIIDPSISARQALSYTGAANFSLFVALTPGAIGIRESFLLASQRAHHVSPEHLIAANVLDRGIYIVFLLLLATIAVSLKTKQRLGVSQPDQKVRQDGVLKH